VHLKITENTTVGHLPPADYHVSGDQTTYVVDNAFRETLDLPGVIISKQRKLIGIISRRKFYEMLGRRYGVAVYLKRPIQVLLKSLDAKTLVVPSKKKITDTVRMAPDREHKISMNPIKKNMTSKDIASLMLSLCYVPNQS
jgi:two-component system NtrC family sensor kinase